jgi:drug/metabolite transporter (DMT)-like permease
MFAGWFLVSHDVMSAGWFFLAAMIGMYGVANLLQSVAAARTTSHATLDPKLLMQLVRHRIYLAGLFCQIAGFVLAFLARRDLPLFLVQASVAAGLGVTAVLGVLTLNWRLPRVEVLLLAVLCVGLAGLVISAEPHPSRPLSMAGVLGLFAVLILIAIAGFFAARLRGVPGSVGLGALAGIAFGAAAVASRPLASIGSTQEFVSDPLLYLLIAHSLVGQLLLGLAMQRGSTTAAVAAMDAAAAVPAAIVGLLFLGDQITPGREWMAASGFLLTLGSVIGLTFFAEPQHHHETAGRHRFAERLPGVHARTLLSLGRPRNGVPHPTNGHNGHGLNGAPPNGVPVNGAGHPINGGHQLNGGHQPAPLQRPPVWPPASS